MKDSIRDAHTSMKSRILPKSSPVNYMTVLMLTFSLISHWSGRILKVEGDYDIPEYSSQIIKIGDAHEQKDVIVHGIVTKVSDTVEFTSSNGEPGFVKTIEIGDGTGTIRVTLWRDDTKMNISKGDMLKVIGGNVEYDDFSRAYRVNTNWNSEFKINAADDLEIKESLEEKYHSRLVPIG